MVVGFIFFGRLHPKLLYQCHRVVSIMVNIFISVLATRVGCCVLEPGTRHLAARRPRCGRTIILGSQPGCISEAAAAAITIL